MDYNWYFSTLAQSGAAILGLFGAFLLSNLLSRITQHGGLLREFKSLRNESLHRRRNLANRNFDWYNQRIFDQVVAKDDFRKKLRKWNLEDPNTCQQILTDYDFSIFSDPKQIILQLQAKRRNITTNRIDTQLRLSTPALTHAINEESDRINDAISEAKYAAARAKSLRDAFEDFEQSASFYTKSIIVLAFLIFATVIYPISWIPVPIGSVPTVCGNLSCAVQSASLYLSTLPGVLLALISILLLGFLASLIHINLRLRFAKENYSELDKNSIVESYSPYLQNRKLYYAVIEKGWPSA